MPLNYSNNYQQGFSPYPQSYGQSYNQQSYAQPQIQPQMQSNQGTINWVQGEIGARAYPVGPNMSVLLMDSEGQNFYIKTADQSGMPSLKKYAYSEVVEEPLRLESRDNREIDTSYQATRDEVKKLQEEIKDLKNQLATMEIDMRNANEAKSGGRKNG